MVITMEKILPLGPANLSSVYLTPCLLLSILSAEPARYDWLYSNTYLLSAAVYEQGNLIYNDGYVKVFYDFTRLENLNSYFEITEYTDLDAPQTIEAVPHILSEDHYVMIDIDEFYIPNTYFYHRVHYYRKFLIYGYHSTDQFFHAKSYDRFGQLSEFHLPYQELSLVIDRQSTQDIGVNREDKGISSYRVMPTRVSEYRHSQFLKQIASYLGRNEERVTERDACLTYYFGLKVYDVVRQALSSGLHNLEKIDYRAFALMASHKQGIAEFLMRLSREQTELGDLSDIVRGYRELDTLLAETTKLILYPYETREKKNKNYALLNKTLSQALKQDEKICSTLYHRIKSVVKQEEL